MSHGQLTIGRGKKECQTTNLDDIYKWKGSIIEILISGPNDRPAITIDLTVTNQQMGVQSIQITVSL